MNSGGNPFSEMGKISIEENEWSEVKKCLESMKEL